MEFQVIPVIDKMLELYRKPPSPRRFRDYLLLLHGDTHNDLSLPLGGYNPMAKEQTRQRLLSLKILGAEDVAASALAELNETVADIMPGKVIRLAINLSDDVRGGWTNRYTSDYDSKFRINALLSRDCCAPVFWASEIYYRDMIGLRVQEYAWRHVYRQNHSAPASLEEHLMQEAFVAQHLPASREAEVSPWTEEVYQKNKHSCDYHTIFNFLYGSKACSSLKFPVRFKIEDFAGYYYAASISSTPAA